jgi:hypothetical protein
MELAASKPSGQTSRLIMAAISQVYTIERAAMMLGISEEILDRIADTMEWEDGILWIYDSTEDGRRGFTDFGTENVLEILGDPSQMEFILQDLPVAPA